MIRTFSSYGDVCTAIKVNLVDNRQNQKLKRNPLGNSNGFTLLELLISFTIIAIIIAIVFGALRIGVRSWQKGEASIASNQQIRTVFNLMARQISSKVMKMGGEAKAHPFVFYADSSRVEFFSKISLVPENNNGVVYVQYKIVKDDDTGLETLAFYEKNIILINPESYREPLEEQFQSLISGAEISFSVLDKTPGSLGESNWIEGWDRSGFPTSLRIEYREKTGDTPFRVVIPLLHQPKT